MFKISGIYKIQSKKHPSRCYIGSAKNISLRIERHLWELKNNNHKNIKLQRHYNKHGKSDLIFSVLVGCDVNDLIKTEQYFIDSYNPFFNICKVAGSKLGIKHSEESKKKIALKLLGRKRPPFSETTKLRMKISASKRPPVTIETRLKIIEKKTGLVYVKHKNII